ncbi:MAG: hypothetical protein U0359_37690 [Byssovorax sp.]
MTLIARKTGARFAVLAFLGALGPALAPGCGGNTTVPPGAPDWQSCTGPGQCTLAGNACCSPCGGPELADLDGVNREKLDVHFKAVCPDPVPCPKCAIFLEPNFAAFCVSDACKALDVRTSAVSACEADADCQLRYTGCCEACGGTPEGLIALNKASLSTYAQQVCAPDQDCPACAPIYPAEYSAVCNASKHCEVKQGPAPCPDESPASGSACTVADQVCTYGTDPRQSCRTIATCTGGSWQILAPKCKGLSGPGMDGCPLMPDATGDCPTEGLLCDMGEGALCACGSCVGGPCSVTAHWGCVSAPADPGCPPVLPDIGAHPCTGDVTCVYGVCGTPTSAGRVCEVGVWRDSPVACPQ